jgi:hypothetical protein
VPLDGRLVYRPDLSDQPVHVRPYPARLLAAHLLKRVAGPHPDEFVGLGEAGEQLLQALPIGDHDGHHLFRATERVGMAALEHLRERLGHSTGDDRRQAR